MCKDLDLLKGKLAESPDAAHDLILALVVRVAVRRRLSQQCENNNLNKPQLVLHILQDVDVTAYLVGKTAMFEGQHDELLAESKQNVIPHKGTAQTDTIY